MVTYLVRVALPDRPGALGAVASRIGAVRADVIGVEILERTGGRAIDEFVVDLGDDAHVDLLTSEIEEVDGVVVETVRPLPGGGGDRRQEAYEGAAAVLSETTPEGVLCVLASLARRELEASWAAVVDAAGGERAILCADGRTPTVQWLVAYAVGTTRGSTSSASGSSEPSALPDAEDTLGAAETSDALDVAWAEMANWDLLLMVGRPGVRFTGSEESRLEALAALADARWADLARLRANSSHPSCVG